MPHTNSSDSNKPATTHASKNDTAQKDNILPKDTASPNSDRANRHDDGYQVSDMPLTEHLIELRQHLIKIMIAIAIAFLPMLFFFNDIYYLFSQPLMGALPSNSQIVANDLVSGFMAQVRLCIMLSIFIVIPYILYQIWSFIAPGLYQSEKHIALPVLVSSVLLFYAGVAFAYVIILQRALFFLVTILPSNVTSMPDMESYLNFATKILMVFGVAFEIPVFVFLLVASGITTVVRLADKRRYVIVGCFAASGVLSPPDVASMIMLAIPMMLLFEVGLLASRLLLGHKVLDT